MTGSFDGNDGNDGNAANSGGAGNASSINSGWYFADRVNLPFVTTPDTGPYATPGETIGDLKIIADIARFPSRNWSVEWYTWLAAIEFTASNWKNANPIMIGNVDPTTNPLWPAWVVGPLPINWPALAANVQVELEELVTAAANERADALDEILSQANEFVSYFLNLLTANPGAYPETTKVLNIASQIGTFVAMYYKGQFKRPRASQLCPALLPPIEVPGHASFPSGHSTQAHLMALCMGDVLQGLPKDQIEKVSDDLWTLADRIARNREIAGLHYRSDTDAGKAIAQATLPQVQASVPIFLANTNSAGISLYQLAVNNAQKEWQAGDGP